MKFIFLASFLLIFVFPGSTTAVTKGEEVVLKLKRYDYYAYTRAIFHEQKETSIYFELRGYGKDAEFHRRDVIIDKVPLKDEMKPGVRVLTKDIGRNSFAEDIYIPARVTNKTGDKYEVKPVCENKSTQLGFTDGYVYSLLPREAFKASSFHNDNYQPSNARLNEVLTWCSASHDMTYPWLQVDLQENSYICSVTTKSCDREQSITSFTLDVSRDEKTWHYLMENNTRKIFKRDHPSDFNSSDFFTHFVNLVDKPYRFIRFHSVTYHKRPCIGVEVNGYRNVKDPPHIISMDKLRMEGSVCNLQNKCVEKQNAECHDESMTLGTYTCRCKSGSPNIFLPDNKYFNCSEGFAYRGKKVVAAERSKQQAISQDGKEHSNPCLPNPCKGPKDICERRGNKSQYDCVCSKCFPGKDCGSGALGMEDKSIPNIAITASSTYEGVNHRYLPSEGRLRNTRDVNVRERSGCWAPEDKSNSYFQVDLSRVMLVSGIATQGNQWTVINEYVTTYSVAYSLNGTNWEDYKEEKSTLKVFNGNTEATSIVTNSFSREIKARYIRVLPLSWESWPSLRVEFYGCSL